MRNGRRLWYVAEEDITAKEIEKNIREKAGDKILKVFKGEEKANEDMEEDQKIIE